MENFLIIAPYFAWVFALTLSLHVAKNVTRKTYNSGSVLGWIIACLSHSVLAIYMLSIGEFVIGAQQSVSALLTLTLIVQSIVLKKI